MRLIRTVGGLAALGAAGIGYSLLEARAYTLRRFTLPVLPAGSSSVRVLHLSDLHMLPEQTRKQGFVRRLAELEPDLVVSTGDNLAHRDAVAPVLAAHGELLDVPGVFVLGSNDYWAPRLKNPARYLLPNGGARRIHGERLPSADLVRGFTAAGWLDLTNRRDRLRIAGIELEFAGVDDPHLDYDRYHDIAGPAAADTALTIGVMHAPYRRVLDAMAADGAGLLIAGHTHGGQLCLPGMGALVTNCDLPRRQAKGVSIWEPARLPSPTAVPAGAGSGAGPTGRREASWLHVSAGLGTSPFTRVRFACRPEATLLTLVAANPRPPTP